MKSGLNWYQYCNSNPTTYVDVLGLEPSKMDMFFFNKMEDSGLMSHISDDYMTWLSMAEGITLYPFLDRADNDKAKERMNVTLGIGFTFDIERTNWDVLKDVLGWGEAEIEDVIKRVYAGEILRGTEYGITEEQAYALYDAINDDYIYELNCAIINYNNQNGYKTNYTQTELEAMLDFAYNNGLGSNEEGVYPRINNLDYIIYYYLRKDQNGAVEAMKNHKGGNRRRLNQTNLFFNGTYEFEEDLDVLRKTLGF